MCVNVCSRSLRARFYSRNERKLRTFKVSFLVCFNSTTTTKLQIEFFFSIFVVKKKDNENICMCITLCICRENKEWNIRIREKTIFNKHKSFVFVLITLERMPPFWKLWTATTTTKKKRHTIISTKMYPWTSQSNMYTARNSSSSSNMNKKTYHRWTFFFLRPNNKVAKTFDSLRFFFPFFSNPIQRNVIRKSIFFGYFCISNRSSFTYNIYNLFESFVFAWPPIYSSTDFDMYVLEIVVRFFWLLIRVERTQGSK